MEVLDITIWTRWRIGVGAPFCARVLFRKGAAGACGGGCENQKKVFLLSPTHPRAKDSNTLVASFASLDVTLARSLAHL